MTAVLRAFEPATGGWTELCDPRHLRYRRRRRRRAGQLVVDGVRQQVLLFGGTSGPYFDELWAFDLTTSSWQRNTGPGPISRGGHSMAARP